MVVVFDVVVDDESGVVHCRFYLPGKLANKCMTCPPLRYQNED